MATGIKLTAGAIMAYLNGNGPDEPILQVINLKKIQAQSHNNNNNDASAADRYRLQVSDSVYYQPCMLVTQLNYLVMNGTLDKFCIIRTSKMVCTTVSDRKILVISQLTVLHPGNSIVQVIGTPQALEIKKVTPGQSSTFNTTQGAQQYNSNNNSNSNISTPISMQVSNISNMDCERVIHPIDAINPYNSKWTICCRVSSKGNLRNWSNAKGEGKLLSFEVSDASGMIRCTAFNDLAVKTDSLITINKVVYISRAELRPANKKFCGNSKHDYELMINDSTIIEECTDSTNAVPNIKYEFKNINDLQTLAKDATVDFIGICREISDLSEFTAKSSGNQLKKRDLKCIDQTKLEVSCTLWDKEAENFDCHPNSIVLIKNAKISEFNGRSLNISGLASITINPDIKECYELKNWFEKEGQHSTIESISKSSFSGSGSQVITPIAVVKNNPNNDLEKGDFYTLRAAVTFMKKDRDIFYKACPSKGCNKKVLEDEAMGNYRCEKCNRDFDNFLYRYMVSMEVQDHSGSVWITCFQDSAEVVLGYSAEDLGHEQETSGREAVERLIDLKLFQTFYFRVRVKRETYQDENKLKVVALGGTIATDNNIEYDCKQLLNMINTLKCAN